MTTVYTNPPTTQDSALDKAQTALWDGQEAERNKAYSRADVHYNAALAAALVAIAESLTQLPALVASQQAIAKVLTDVHSAEYGALAVLDAAHEEKQVVNEVPMRADDDAGKGAVSTQTTTDAQARTKAKLDRLLYAADALFSKRAILGLNDSLFNDLWSAFVEAQRP